SGTTPRGGAWPAVKAISGSISASASQDAYDSVVASDGNAWMVAWSDTRDPSGNAGVWARSISFAGAPAASDFQVALSSTGQYLYAHPQLLFAGGTFLSEWEAIDSTTGQSTWIY